MFSGHQLQMLVLSVAAVAGFYSYLRAIRRESDPWIRRIIGIALPAKLVGTALYYFIIQDVYGQGDANRYIRNGSDLAPVIRSGSLPDQAREVGTPFMDFLAGVAFAAFGASEIVGYLVFSMLSLTGMYLFFLAFRLGFPEGDHRRYAALIFLLPTMVFWPSTIGKEPWLVFALGVASYGAARAFRSSKIGYLLVALGTAGVFAIRPHMAALLALSIGAAFAVRIRDKTTRVSLVGWVVSLAVITSGAVYVLVSFSEEESGAAADQEVSATDRVRSSTDSILERTTTMTTRGGSEFESRPVRSPIDLAHALATVPFRPFFFEAHNRQAQLASLEGLVLLLLVLHSLPRMRNLWHWATRRAYVMLATTYTLGFVIAFSNVGNFGILTRQRAQLIPFLIVLLCLPLTRRQEAAEEAAEVASAPRGLVPSRSGRPPVLVLAPPSPVAAPDGPVAADTSQSGDSLAKFVEANPAGLDRRQLRKDRPEVEE